MTSKEKIMEKLSLSQQQFQSSDKVSEVEEISQMAYINSELALALIEVE